MKIKELEIRNFKSLTYVRMENVPDVVVIAGPNGVGKSSLLEAIIWFKQMIGPYYPVAPNSDIISVNADSAYIKIKFELSPEEIQYLSKVHDLGMFEKEIPGSNEITGAITIKRNGEIIRKASQHLSKLLMTYDRENYPEVGMFEYLYPNRRLRKKILTNLNFSQLSPDQEKTRRIFNQEKKLDLTKEYLAKIKFGYLQEIDSLLRNGGSNDDLNALENPLKPIMNIFNHFLAPKEFYDVDVASTPIKVIFKTPSGNVEIDDLSSGEKEIISVFSNLYKLNLQNSIVLFDEPDLHLNQELEKKILSALKNLGTNNQFWITTHSFGIMDSVNFSELYRIEQFKGDNQLIQVFDNKALYSTFKSIAGNAGIVTLGEKVVFLEGIDFNDKHILESWFKNYLDKITFVSSGPLSNVLKVNEKILQLIETSSKFNFFYAIRDRDFLSDIEIEEFKKTNERLFVWDRYHIENYLIDFHVIFEVLKRNYSVNPCSSVEDVIQKMKRSMLANKERYLSKMINHSLNSKIGQIRFKVGISDPMEKALEKSQEIKERTNTILDENNVKQIIGEAEKDFKQIIDEDVWMYLFPGRALLKDFAREYTSGISYEQLKNQITHEIKKQERIPQEVVDKITFILK